MNFLILKIIEKIPRLKRAYMKQIAENEKTSPRIPNSYLEWRLLARADQTYLLGIPGTYDRRGSVMPAYSSALAVVKQDGNAFKQMFLETYEPSTKYGLLHTPTSHAIVVRLDEYEDTDGHRYGFDDVYIVDYGSNVSRSLERFHFKEGYYHGGNIKLALCRSRNWLGFAREEYDGWMRHSRIMTCVYDLAGMQLVIKSELLGLESLNTIAFSSSGTF